MLFLLISACASVNSGNIDNATVLNWENEAVTTEQFVRDHKSCLGITRPSYEPRSRIAILLKSESPIAYYVLFNSLKHLPEHQALVRKCCVYIMKRNNDMAYNMVSILRCYFGITDLRSQLSLRIEPYELSLVDRSYQTFLDFLNGKRPKV